jgi:hypothetical protein
LRGREGWGVFPADAIKPDRPSDVLQLRLTEILEVEVEFARRVLLNTRRDADAAGLGQALEPRRNVDAVAEDVAVIDHDVALMAADTKLDALFFRHAGVALGRAALRLDRSAHRSDDAGELDEQSIAVALTIWPRCSAILGSPSSRRIAFKAASVPSSFAPISPE